MAYKIILFALIMVLGYFYQLQDGSDSLLSGGSSISASETSGNSATTTSDAILAHAFENGRSDLQVSGTGQVRQLLSDDRDGSRHQRFILRLSSGQTLLVAHNIDLAPRVANLSEDDTVEFYGVYEWNNQGGVIHWTHHDPNGTHPAGWLKHQGRTYQ